MRLARVAVLLVPAVLLAGCVNISEHLTVHRDGTAAVATKLTMPSALWNIASLSQKGNPFQTMVNQVKSKYPDASVQPVRADNQDGVLVSMPFKTVAGALAFLKRADRSTDSPAFFVGAGATELGHAPFIHAKVYTFRTANLSSSIDQAAAQSPATAGISTAQLTAAMVEVSFALTLPERIRNAPGAAISADRHTATWPVPLSGGVSMTVTTEPTGVPPWAAALLAAVLIAAIVAGVVAIRRRGRAAAESRLAGPDL